MVDIVDLIDIAFGKLLELLGEFNKAFKVVAMRHLANYRKYKEYKKGINSKYSRFRVKLLDEKAFHKIKEKSKIHSINSDLIVYKGKTSKINKKRNNNKEDKINGCF